MARILGHCLEYRSSVGTSPDSPYTPPARSSLYGFSPHIEVSQGIEENILLRTESAPVSHSPTQLDVPTIASTSRRPTPVLVKPRSVVLLVEDNSVNMKVCHHVT